MHPRFLHSNATSHKWALGGKGTKYDNSVMCVSGLCRDAMVLFHSYIFGLTWIWLYSICRALG